MVEIILKGLGDKILLLIIINYCEKTEQYRLIP